MLVMAVTAVSKCRDRFGDPAETYDGSRVPDRDQCTDGSFGYRTPEAFEVLPVQKIRCDDTTKKGNDERRLLQRIMEGKGYPSTTRSGIRPMIGFGSGRPSSMIGSSFLASKRSPLASAFLIMRFNHQ